MTLRAQPDPALRQPPRVWRRLRRVVERASEGVNHADVHGRVAEAGAMGGGYLMMTAISAAIAILGLLLSSPAVVIGAMLLSPLMGPIILLGFSFWTVDWASTRKALASLGAGFGVALAVSVGLTLLSPLKEPTAEILARAHPTLFDLLVAIFSGVAGGYAVVRHRGETVIGVAIATALMPPLAVVGFGAGTGAWMVAGGALLLFFTNLIAIALAAAVVAAISGFRPQVHFAHGGWIAQGAVLAILAVLCVPLTLGLKTIADESRATAETRAEIGRLFGPKARIASLAVRDSRHVLEVDGLIATQRFVDRAPEVIGNDLKRRLHMPVRINLDQVVLADPSRIKPTPAATAVVAPDPALAAAAALRSAVPYPDAATSYDAATGEGLVRLGPGSGLDLAGALALESALRMRPGGDRTVVTPPVQPLPAIPLDTTHSPATLTPAVLQRWALERWGASSVEAVLCRGGRRGVRQAQVAGALAQAFAPLPVTLKPAEACTASGPPPYVTVAPGPLRAPAPAPAATTAPGTTGAGAAG